MNSEEFEKRKLTGKQIIFLAVSVVGLFLFLLAAFFLSALSLGIKNAGTIVVLVGCLVSFFPAAVFFVLAVLSFKR